MDFAWSEERRALRDAAVAFAEQHLREGVVERDRQCVFSRELWRACAEFGVQGLLVAPEFGGAGQDLLDTVAVLEGLGFGGLDNGLVFSAYILHTSGSTGQPKCILHTHLTGMAFVDWAVREYDLTPADRLSNHSSHHTCFATFDFFAAARVGAAAPTGG
jgi:non-ribosomal peptide synthetase component F